MADRDRGWESVPVATVSTLDCGRDVSLHGRHPTFRDRENSATSARAQIASFSILLESNCLPFISCLLLSNAL